MTCQLCSAKSRARYDEACVDCCVRLLAEMPAHDLVVGRMQAIKHKFGAEHFEKVKSAWRAHVEARNKAGDLPVDGFMREWA